MKKSKENAETPKIDTLTTAELKAMLKAIFHTASAKHPELDDLVPSGTIERPPESAHRRILMGQRKD